MELNLDLFQDKIEFFEDTNLKDLERKINEQIQHNKAILLEVHSVSHQVALNIDGQPLYSAVVHFKQTK
ncbi:DUF2536 family protein [Bacillus sp. 2205SS5-2]|uniref:DUF2536 family protein n=1 Tax=Bacillus sp. 2205SS5-2 TaxID=3109031 RepID=UPI003004CBCA